MQGIFKRTNAPKFAIETPTDKAKNMANVNEKSTKELALINLKKPKNFNLKSK